MLLAKGSGGAVSVVVIVRGGMGRCIVMGVDDWAEHYQPTQPGSWCSS